MTIDNPEIEPISEELRNDLKKLRDDLSSLLNGYIEEIPDDIISGKQTHKCQVWWFSDIAAYLGNLDLILPDNFRSTETTELLQDASNFIDEYREKNISTKRKKGERYRTTEEDIQKGNEILKRSIKELNAILD